MSIVHRESVVHEVVEGFFRGCQDLRGAFALDFGPYAVHRNGRWAGGGHDFTLCFSTLCLLLLNEKEKIF